MFSSFDFLDPSVVVFTNAPTAGAGAFIPGGRKTCSRPKPTGTKIAPGSSFLNTREQTGAMVNTVLPVGHQLANSGTEKLVFKVKSSNNNEYKVKPVFGFVEPGASTALEITRTAGAPKEDKLVVQFGPAPADAADATAAFTAIAAAPAGTISIPLSATA